MAEERFFHFHPRGTVTQLKSREEALSQVGKTGFVWFDFNNPAREWLESLIGPLNLNTLAVEDCLDEEQVPKIENFENNTFILFNVFTYAQRKLLIDEVNFFLGVGYLVSVRGHHAHNPQFFDKLDEFIRIGAGEVKKGPDFLLQVILDYIVDKKYLAIDGLQEELETSEEKILADVDSFKPEELIHLRRYLLTLRKSLFYEREILVKASRKDSPHISEKAIHGYRDLYDHLTKFFELVEINREMITSLMEVYLSMLNNRMSKNANRTNETMKRLTVITTIFMPLTLLSGIGGMSEWSMMTGAENWMISYPLFLLGMLVIGVGNYLLLRWKKWI